MKIQNLIVINANLIRVLIWWITAFLLILLCIFFGEQYKNNRAIYLNVEMKSSKSGSAQVFYDVGSGINERDSTKLVISHSDTFHKYIFRMSDRPVKYIRFDPIDINARIVIGGIKLEDQYGGLIEEVPLEKLKDLHGIERIKYFTNNTNILIVSNENDPQLEIPISGNLESRIKLKQIISHSFIRYVLPLIVFCIIFIAIFRCRSEFSKTFEVRRPLLFIFCAACLACIASSYPIFFGKSLNYTPGLPMLYETVGWFPGYFFDGLFENYRGSDIATHSWSFSPISKVSYNSIFEDKEFPFWNRFVGGGIPLWSQGCYMIGDPLHWITIIFKASSYAWDIKFLLSKLIFSFGIGVLSYKLTRKLTIGLIITGISPFIGYYTFAFNHPTYFCLTYMPWVILQWIGLSKYLTETNRRSYIGESSRMLLLVLLSWIMLNSGNTKESVIVFGFVSLWGFMLIFTKLAKKYCLKTASIYTVLIGAILIFCISPYTLNFLDALQNSATSYDSISNDPYRTSLILGFFEPLIFQKYSNNYVGPSTNIALLFLIICSLTKSNFSNLHYKITFLLFTLAFSFAYGLIPNNIVFLLPMINRIGHTGITFSIPMIMFGFMLASFGASSLKRENLYRNIIRFLFLYFIIFALNFTMRRMHSAGILTAAFFALLFLFTVIYLIYIEEKALKKIPKLFSISNIVIFIIFILTIKNGLHLTTGSRIDNYINNPGSRLDTSLSSPSVDYIKSKISEKNEPTRVIGADLNFIPGVGHYFGIESIGSAEALKNPYLEELYSIVGIPPEPGWGWFRKYIPNKTNDLSELVYDSLGVGFILSTADTVSETPNRIKVHTSDLDVHERVNVWPRAFFVRDYLLMESPRDFPVLLKNRHGSPMATILKVDQEGLNVSRGNSTFTEYKKAEEYALTNNKTCFTVDAPSSGIVVLGETYYPLDYKLLVNGVKTKYFRVNLWQKGFEVQKPGKYIACYQYEPNKLKISFILGLIGLIIIFLFPYLRILINRFSNPKAKKSE